MTGQANLQKHKGDTPLLNTLIIESIQDKKGTNVIQLDMRHLAERPSDYFIICQGDSPTQINAIAQYIYRQVKDEISVSPLHIEGYNSGSWTLLDYFDTVVHIFYPETRALYNLESLWSDAVFQAFEDID